MTTPTPRDTSAGGTRPSEPTIGLDGVSFTYEHAKHPVLRDVTLHLAAGARVAVMGPTGAGKTTLCMVLNGLVPHLHEGKLTGRVRVAGHDTRREKVPQVVRDVGLVMQDPEVQITGRTVEEDTAVGPANLGCPRAELRRRVDETLGLVGLSHMATRASDRLSGGEKQRLAIAGILAMHPRILVLDEPTAELDPAGTNAVFDLVRQLATRQARTIVLVEHEPELVAEWAELVVVVSGGAVGFVGTPGELFRDPERVRAFGLRAPQVAELGWRLVGNGVLRPEEVPITLAEAEKVLVPRLVASIATPAARRATAPPPVAAPPVAPPRSAAPAIEVSGLTHTYEGGVTALAGVSATVTEGEFVAVVGRNGAGKTTFARHLNGLLRPTSGSVRIAGEDTSARSVGELARAVGYVFQNPDHQIFSATVTEEVAYGLRNQGAGEADIDREVARVLDLVGLSSVAKRHPFRLGKGQRQRLAVASVLALSPRILVVDEPTTGQDFAGAESMMQLIGDLHRAGHTILMITHDMTLVARYAARVLVFTDGQLAADCTPRQLFAQPELVTRARLDLPQVTRLAGELAAAGRPGDIDPATLDVASLASRLTDLVAGADVR